MKSAEKQEKQAPPHPRNLRPYRGGEWRGGTDAGHWRCIYLMLRKNNNNSCYHTGATVFFDA